MNNNVTQLLNIGPAVAGYLKMIGITTKEDFLAKDPFSLFAEMLKINPSLPKPLLASLVGAKLNTPWYEIYDGTIKEFEKIYPDHQWRPYFRQ
jgi:hypothetical protein